MATNLESVFLNAINEAAKAAKMIQEPNQKAMAYATIAQAIAATGIVGSAPETPSETPEVAKPATGKDSLKPEAAKKTTPAPAPKEEAPAPAPEAPAEQPEAEYPDVWNDETVPMFADQIAFMQSVKEAYGEETMDNCVQEFSTGQLQTLSDITPHNIQAFVFYMEAMIKQAEEDAAAGE